MYVGVEQGGLTNLNFPIKSTWSTQRGVNGVWPVCRRNDHHFAFRAILTRIFHTIHERQELRHHAFLDLSARTLLAARAYRVDLVEHDDTRTAGACLCKDIPYTRFGLPMVCRG